MSCFLVECIDEVCRFSKKIRLKVNTHDTPLLHAPNNKREKEKGQGVLNKQTPKARCLVNYSNHSWDNPKKRHKNDNTSTSLQHTCPLTTK